MDPIEFEQFIGQLFRKMGYRVEDTPASGDEGVDLVLRRGRRSAVVQCKRYSGSVGQPVVRDLYGTMLHTGAVEAYLVTTGTISSAARQWAEGKPIHLVDGHRLVEWTRTRRLSYDHRPLLPRSRRQFLLLLALTLAAVGAIYLTAPESAERLQRWSDGLVERIPFALGGPVDSVNGDLPVRASTPVAPGLAPQATATATWSGRDPSTGSDAETTPTRTIFLPQIGR